MSVRALRRLTKRLPRFPEDNSKTHWRSGPVIVALYALYRRHELVVSLGNRMVCFRILDGAQPDFVNKQVRIAVRTLLAERTKKPIRNRHLPKFDIKLPPQGTKQ
jgi:hypothetical protein